MIKLLKKILDKIIILEELDDYEQALGRLFMGVGTSDEYLQFLSKYFINPQELYDKLDDCENFEVYKLTDTELKVLTFSDGYDGYLFKFGVDGDKLKIVKSKKVDEDDF